VTIILAQQRQQIDACYPIMQQLRPHITQAEFYARISAQQQSGYHLAALIQQQDCVAVAGFRIGDNLAWGRYLYVEDLVTDAQQRSRGHGRRLLEWLVAHARQQDCQQLHLDSGLQRVDAHRFYQQHGMQHVSKHFSMLLD